MGCEALVLPSRAVAASDAFKRQVRLCVCCNHHSQVHTYTRAMETCQRLPMPTPGAAMAPPSPVYTTYCKPVLIHVHHRPLSLHTPYSRR